MIELSQAERKLLKADAHKLRPVVMIGDKGLTEAVLRAIDASLKSHELIKVKVASDDRAARETVLVNICSALDASPVQHIGKVLVLYRENPILPAVAAPEPAHTKPARAKPARRAGSAPRTRPKARSAGRSK
jgi:RNA-binding protein